MVDRWRFFPAPQCSRVYPSRHHSWQSKPQAIFTTDAAIQIDHHAPMVFTAGTMTGAFLHRQSPVPAATGKGESGPLVSTTAATAEPAATPAKVKTSRRVISTVIFGFLLTHFQPSSTMRMRLLTTQAAAPPVTKPIIAPWIKPV